LSAELTKTHSFRLFWRNVVWRNGIFFCFES